MKVNIPYGMDPKEQQELIQRKLREIQGRNNKKVMRQKIRYKYGRLKMDEIEEESVQVDLESSVLAIDELAQHHNIFDAV